MKIESLPETVQAILTQAGDLGLRGAFVYIGAQNFTCRCAEALGEYRSSRPSRLVSESGQGFVEYEVGLQCRVNGKPGRAWTLMVAYEPNDTYTVWLVEGHRERKPSENLNPMHCAAGHAKGWRMGGRRPHQTRRPTALSAGRIAMNWRS